MDFFLLARFFALSFKSLQMQTFRERNMISRGYSSSLSKIPVSSHQARRLKIREFVSWSVCFAIVAGLTGLLKILKVGITMDIITSGLFYLSLFGLLFFISRIISMSKRQVEINGKNLHELN